MKHLGYIGRKPRNVGSLASPVNVPYPDYEVRVDYARHTPKKEYTVGIGITTHNRPENFRKCLSNILLTTKGLNCKIVVVDDASDIPVEHADFRFRHNAGIAKAKNKCLELLEGCDYFFLFDDDTWPVEHGWWIPYIESGLHHLCFTFDRLHDGRPNRNTLIGHINGLSYYKNPCGCMLFMTKSLIDTIGGFDIGFGKYGNEHVDFSVRAYINGMLPHPFVDIPHSLTLFHSLDYFGEATSSVKSKMGIWNTKNRIGGKGFGFVEYRSMGEKFIVFTSYFNYAADPQRKVFWDDDIQKIMPLVDSVIDHGGEIVVFHDCFEATPIIHGVQFVRVPTEGITISPNVYRYLVYLDFLNVYETDYPVFLTDSTDVICLNGPVGVAIDRIYVGDEFNTFVGNKWMVETQMPFVSHIPGYSDFMEANADSPLLNCGIIGGHYVGLRNFLQLYSNHVIEHCKHITHTVDMALANYIFYKYMREMIIHGEPVNTRFKYFERSNGAWFMHK